MALAPKQLFSVDELIAESEKHIGQKWRIVSDQFGYEMFAAQCECDWSDNVAEAYTYDARDNRDLKLRFWKMSAKLVGLNPDSVKIVEVE